MAQHFIFTAALVLNAYSLAWLHTLYLRVLDFNEASRRCLSPLPSFSRYQLVMYGSAPGYFLQPQWRHLLFWTNFRLRERAVFFRLQPFRALDSLELFMGDFLTFPSLVGIFYATEPTQKRWNFVGNFFTEQSSVTMYATYCPIPFSSLCVSIFSQHLYDL